MTRCKRCTAGEDHLIHHAGKGFKNAHKFEPVAEPASTGEPRLWRYPEDVALPVHGRICLPVQKLAISANPEDHDLPWGIILEDRQTMYDVAELEFTGKAEAKVDWNADNYWFPRMWIEVFGELVIDGKAATIAARPSEPSAPHKVGCHFPNTPCMCDTITVVEAAPQTSAEPDICAKIAHNRYGRIHCDLPPNHEGNCDFGALPTIPAAPQPVSGDAPEQIWVRCHGCHSLLMYKRKGNEIEIYHNCPPTGDAPPGDDKPGQK